MRKLTLTIMAGILFAFCKAGLADTSTAPITAISSEFSASFLAHVTAGDDFRQDGSHVVKFSDGILEAIPYKGDNLLVAAFGVIPHTDNSTQFYKSYSIHVHFISIVSKYLSINPTYAPILQDLELTPGYTYDTDVHHGQLDFNVGYAHQFGGSTVTPLSQ